MKTNTGYKTTKINMVKLPETLPTIIVVSLHYMNSVCQILFTKNQSN